MELKLELIKKIISIIATGTIFLTFIITIFTTNKNSPNFIEYTNLSKFFLNLYTFILLALIFCHSAFPKIICKIFTKKIGLIASDKGKVYLLFSILIMYFGTGSMPQKIFGMVAFISTFSLFLSNLFINCNFKKNVFVEEKIKNQVITTTTANFNNSMNK